MQLVAIPSAPIPITPASSSAQSIRDITAQVSEVVELLKFNGDEKVTIKKSRAERASSKFKALQETLLHEMRMQKAVEQIAPKANTTTKSLEIWN